MHPTKVRYGHESWVEIKPPEGPRIKGVVKNVVGSGDYVVWLPRYVCVFVFVVLLVGERRTTSRVVRCVGRGLWVWWTSEGVVYCTYRERLLFSRHAWCSMGVVLCACLRVRACIYSCVRVRACACACECACV